MLSISCSLIAVFIPLLLMGGIIGRLFREFALTVTASIAVSALVSLTLAPMMCSRFMQRETDNHGRLYRVIESGFDAMLSFYRRTLDVVLRHQAITLGVFFATMALTVVMAIQIPKGFFPIQDTGLIQGFREAAQATSPEEMMRLHAQAGRGHPARSRRARLRLADRQRPAARSRRIPAASSSCSSRATSASSSASQIIDRLRPQLAKVAGRQPVPAADPGHHRRRPHRPRQLPVHLAGPQYRRAERVVAEAAGKAASTLPQLADVSSDLLASAPQLKVTINRDQASRFGISPQAIDDTLNDAFGQRQITQYFTQLNTYCVILEILPELQNDLSIARPPLRQIAAHRRRGAAVGAGRRRFSKASVRSRSRTRASSRRSPSRSTCVPGVALGQAVDAINQASREIGMPAAVIADLPGQRPGVPDLAASEPALIAAALIVVYIILGMLYESFIHPLTILSTLPSAGIGALLALQLGHMDLSVIGIIGIILLIGIVKKNGIMLVDFAIAAERERHMPPLAAIREACLLRFRPILMTTAAAMLAGIPLALGNGTGSELRQPLGYAMVGGLALSQVLTLYTTPVVYLYLDRLQTWLLGPKRAPVEQDEEVHKVAAE